MSDNVPPLPPKPPLSKINLAFAAIGVLAMLGVLVAALVTAPKHKRPKHLGKTGEPEVVDVEPGAPPEGPAVIPAIDEKEAREVAEVGSPSVWIDIANPAALRSALAENAWLQRATSSPLGAGFLDSWLAFFGSKSDDLGLAAVLASAPQTLMKDVLADVLLSQPARVTFFTGPGGNAPAFIVPRPAAALTTTMDGLMSTLARGGYTIEACPGEPVPAAPPVVDAGVADGAADGGASDAKTTLPANPNRFEVVRWRVADHVVYAAHARDRFALSQDSASVIAAVCAPVPPAAVAGSVPGDKPADIRVSFDPEKVGREAQALTAFLGGSTQPSFDLALDGTRLVPVGIRGGLERPDRLGAEPIPDDTWKLVPEDMPVFLAAELVLPKELDSKALASFWKNPDAKVATKPRHVVLVWQPHGDDDAPTEVGLVWSDVGDREHLQDAFSGPNHVVIEEACKRVVVASTDGLLARMKSACSGKTPSVLFAKPDVVASLKQPLSVGLVVDAGRALSAILVDGWKSDEGHAKKTPPKEIDDAKKMLMELPRFGLIGTANGAALAPRGFSS